MLVPIGSLGTGITGSCELLSLGDGNKTSILCKNSKYPYQLSSLQSFKGFCLPVSLITPQADHSFRHIQFP